MEINNSATLESHSSQADFTAKSLIGHKKSVIAIDVAGKDENRIVSGSEDHTVRIWDSRMERAVKCISGCFTQAVEAVKFSEKNDFNVFCSSGISLYLFDLRTDGIIIKTPSVVYENITSEDINALALPFKGDLIALSDDSGTVTILEHTVQGRKKRLSRVHTSIVGTIAFRPQNMKELASGGFDCRLATWDYSIGR